MCTMCHNGPSVNPPPLSLGSQAKAREAGKLRIEGKEYIILEKALRVCG